MTHENLVSILNLGLGLGLSWQLDILDIFFFFLCSVKKLYHSLSA